MAEHSFYYIKCEYSPVYTPPQELFAAHFNSDESRGPLLPPFMRENSKACTPCRAEIVFLLGPTLERSQAPVRTNMNGFMYLEQELRF